MCWVDANRGDAIRAAIEVEYMSMLQAACNAEEEVQLEQDCQAVVTASRKPYKSCAAAKAKHVGYWKDVAIARTAPPKHDQYSQSA